MIFADTSFWIAFRVRQDPRHHEALSLARAHDHAAIVTTNHVLGETWTFLRRRFGHSAAVRMLDAVGASHRLRVVHVSAELETEAVDWLRTHDEREYSFVDATSFAVMRSLRMAEAFAFDGDFSAAGFIELRA